MRDASWPNSLHFNEPSTWHSFVAKAADPPVISSAPLRRLNESRRAACTNWWALGITLGLFAGSAVLHPAQAQSVDYLKAGTALFRKRQGGALMPATTAAQYSAPSDSERSIRAEGER
jgi:hypothetical protein